MAYLPTEPKARNEFIKKERTLAAQKLALESRKIKGVPDQTSEPNKALYERLDKLLTALRDEVTMTPAIKKETQIDVGLKMVFANDEFHFPQQFVDEALALYEKWEAENWGAVAPNANEAVTETNDEDARPAKRAKKDSSTDATPRSARILYPPADHRIWGVDGIMHGLAIKKGEGGRKSTILNTQYDKRSSAVYGHNGLEVGSWFPYQLSALFYGAHGSSQAGISGDSTTGAYSIVVASHYDDLDKDFGDSIYYSGSNSHDNADKEKAAPSTSGTLALHASLSTENPVRVLRSYTGKSPYRPLYGLRYDGLYRVVSVQEPRNGKGGKYEQFKLERLEDQVSLEQLRRLRPSMKEMYEFEKVGDGFPRS